jgi:hypothetical protein
MLPFNNILTVTNNGSNIQVAFAGMQHTSVFMCQKVLNVEITTIHISKFIIHTLGIKINGFDILKPLNCK